MVIAIDFDGTCTAHDFPRIGRDIGAPAVLRELVENGHQLVLFTMRSDVEEVSIPEGEDLHPEAGDYLTQAVKWFEHHGIPLYGIQKNPTQEEWTKSPKAYAHLYIDDAALGAPLIYPADRKRPYIDWKKVREELVAKGIIR